ncbi:MAG: type VI secretion system baseplate subunit TssG [Candidatus Thiodiazotropha sp.]|jgi:type VI secretion system protein ImpH
MVNENRTTTAPIISELLRNPQQFSFYQAIRLLVSSVDGGVTPGNAGSPACEPLRFRPHASLAFPSSDVTSVEILDGNEGNPQFRMDVNFMGLYGPASPLPAFYTEEIIDGSRDESPRRDFLDLFHHRSISLLYRSWQKYRYYEQFQADAVDQFSQWMLSLVGLGDPALRKGLDLDWERLLAYLGVLSMRGRSAPTLSRIVSHYFNGLPVAVDQWVERRVRIDETQRASLGHENCGLGLDCTIGERVRDISGKFRVLIGPLGFDGFREFLPQGHRYRALRDLIRFALRDQLEFDVELTLQKQEVPDLTLAHDNLCQLGWSSWLGNIPERSQSVVIAQS